MPKRFLTSIIAFLFCPLVGFSQIPPIEKFVWMCGLWEQNNASARAGEHFFEEWDIVNDNLLMGKCYSTYAQYEGYIPDTIITENLLLSVEDGKTTYTATVYGQNDDKPVSFDMTGDAENVFTFENAAHNFPKKIVYNRTSDNTVTATISGGEQEMATEMKKLESYYGGLKQYYFVMLTDGPTRNQDAETAAKIQADHLANIQKLHDAGKLPISGPFVTENEWKGIFIFDSTSQKEVEELLNADPAIQAGRLKYTILPWASQKGTKLE